jgi:hypothetical protein
MRVSPQLLEVTLSGVVANQRSPSLHLGGDACDQVAQLAAIEIAVLADV